MIFNRKDQKGQSLVEFAFVLPLFLALFFGVIQFALVFSSQILLNSATKEGARVAVIGAHDNVIESRVLEVTSNMPVLDVSQISISPDYQSRITGQLNKGNIDVETVGYVNMFFPLPGIANDGKYKLYSSSSMHFESFFTTLVLEEGQMGVPFYNLYRDKNRLYFYLEVMDWQGHYVGGAEVSFKIQHDGEIFFDGQETTGTAGDELGSIEKRFNNPGSGTYRVDIISITKEGLEINELPLPLYYTWQ